MFTFSQKRIHSLCIAFILLSFLPGSGCTPPKDNRSYTKATEETKTVLQPNRNLTGPFQPGHLAVLFPVDFNKTGTYDPDDDLKTSTGSFLEKLDGALPSLRAVMNPEFFAGLMTLISTDRDSVSGFSDRSPLAQPGIRELFTDLAIDEWRITSTRFVPCDEPVFSVPRPWHETKLGGSTLGEMVCRPRIRLSVQRFGIPSDRMGERYQGTADDKALHIVFDYTGDTPELQQTYRKALATELKLAAEWRSEQANGQPAAAWSSSGAVTKDAFSQAIQAAYSEGEGALASDLAGLRAAFLMMVRSTVYKGNLPSAGALTALQATDPSHASLVRDFLASELSRHTAPSALALNFSPTGAAIRSANDPSKLNWFSVGFSQDWTFAAITLSDDLLSGLARSDESAFLKARGLFKSGEASAGNLKPARLDFVVDRSNQLKVFGLGLVEIFSDSGTNAVDRDFVNSSRAHNMSLADAQAIFSGMGLQLFADLIESSRGGIKLDTPFGTPEVEPETGTLNAQAQRVQRGIAAVLDTSAHSIRHASCTSCHVVSSTRAKIDPRIGDTIDFPNKMPYASFTKMYDMSAVGPGLRLVEGGQATFSKSWNTRMFGYFGRIPTIADRTVAEVNRDVDFANRNNPQ